MRFEESDRAKLSRGWEMMGDDSMERGYFFVCTPTEWGKRRERIQRSAAEHGVKGYSNVSHFVNAQDGFSINNIINVSGVAWYMSTP